MENIQNEGYDRANSGGQSSGGLLRRDIERWFEKETKNMLGDLARLVAVRSVRGEAQPGMPFGEGPARALEVAAEILERLGFKVENFENRVITADLGEGEPALGILCHLDVVPEGEGWSCEPFAATVRDGKVFGRGTADDKGPAVAAMYAMRAVRELCPDLSRGCRIILGSAEETGSEDIAAYRTAHKMPPNVFTPDASYPIVNLEKGRLCPEFSAAWEKSDALPRVASLVGGDTANRVPDKARALVLGLDAESMKPLCREYAEKTGAAMTAEPVEGGVMLYAAGKGAHGAEPESGVNAQTALLSLLNALDLADCGSTRAVKTLCRLFPHGDTEGRALGIAVRDDLSGALTVNFGVLEITETGLLGNLDIRLPLASTDENTDNVLLSAFRAAGFEVAIKDKSPVHHTPRETHFVQTLLRIYEEHTGRRGECLSTGGQTYVHGIKGGVAFGCSFPGTDNHLHGADEFIGVDELVLSGVMFTRAIIEMCR